MATLPPPSAGGNAAAADEREERIACVVENRGREVAIATMSPTRTHILQVFVCQDSQSYAETIDLLLDLKPKEILLHDGTRNKPLAQKIKLLSGGPHACLPIFIARGYFDQDRGLELLKKLSMEPLDQDLMESYITGASAHCLLRYVESTFSCRFPPQCLKVQFGYGYGGRLVIDRHSVKDLELISNSRTGSQKESLFGVLNKTKTDVGAKALKANLIAPLTDKVTIEGRLDLIELLISRGGPDTVDNLQGTLSCMTALDRMLSGVAVVDAKENIVSAKRQVNTLILLKTFLKLLPALVDELERLLPATDDPAEDEPAKTLLRAIVAALSPPAFADVSALIADYISESTVHERSAKTRRLQECFAINAGICGLLDVARKTFLLSVEDIYALASQYAKEHGLPELRVLYNANRGYYLSLPATIGDLPPIFIQSAVVKKQLQCTTQELASLSRAADESANQAILLTCAVLRDNLLGRIREYVEPLFKAVEAVALLDMVLSFADLVLSDDTGPWTRPELTTATDSALAIKQARHPVVCQYVPGFVPNDAFAGRFGNLVVVSGVNGSGKTCLVKTVALVVVLAHMGCFVPAEAASVPIRDRLLTSLSTSDDMESNLSTFMAEMRRAAYVLDNLTPRSLVILDELGRGTSNMDGSALSRAIAEGLLGTPALTFFVTHYRLLIAGGLSSAYGNVRQVHLEASLSEDTRQLSFKHRITEGPSQITSGYGIALAAHVGFPEDVLQNAERIKQLVEAEEEKDEAGKEHRADTNTEPAWKYEVLRRLMLLKDCLVGDQKKSPEEARQLLQTLRAGVVAVGGNEGGAKEEEEEEEYDN